MASAGERIEARFGERLELEFPITVSEVREHVKAEPVADGFVKGAQDARLVSVAGVALEQFFRFFAAITAKIRVQQIDHRPEMAALFNVHLKQIAQIVE